MLVRASGILTGGYKTSPMAWDLFDLEAAIAPALIS